MSHVAPPAPESSARRSTMAVLVPTALLALGVVLLVLVGHHPVHVPSGGTSWPCGHALHVAWRRPVVEPTDFGSPGAWAGRCQRQARDDLAAPLLVTACGLVWLAAVLPRRAASARRTRADRFSRR